jgi:hypothetical protein
MVPRARDVRVEEGERRNENAKPRQSPPQLRRVLGAEPGAPVRAERVVQRVIDRRARPQAAPNQDRRSEERASGDRRPNPAGRRLEITLGGGDQRDGEHPVEGHER